MTSRGRPSCMHTHRAVKHKTNSIHIKEIELFFSISSISYRYFLFLLDLPCSNTYEARNTKPLGYRSVHTNTRLKKIGSLPPRRPLSRPSRPLADTSRYSRGVYRRENTSTPPVLPMPEMQMRHTKKSSTFCFKRRHHPYDARPDQTIFLFF